MLIAADYDHIDWGRVDHSFPWYPHWFEFCPYEQTLETDLNGEFVYAAVSPTIKLRNDIHIVGFQESDT